MSLLVELGGKKFMARFSFSIFPNSGGNIMECLPWILCCFGCNEERVSWRQKSVFCLIIAIFNQRKICSSWRSCIKHFSPHKAVACTSWRIFLIQMGVLRAWERNVVIQGALTFWWFYSGNIACPHTLICDGGGPEAVSWTPPLGLYPPNPDFTLSFLSFL